MRHFASWYYTARAGTILYGWACLRLAVRYWRFLVFGSDKYGPREVEGARIQFFESLDPKSISDDFIRNNHLRLQ
jgi:hypothetical protein